MIWLASNWVSMLSLAVSFGGLGVAIRYHCKRDDERFGSLIADV
jgi:hypothetical protein